MSSISEGNGHKHITETPDVSHIRNVEVTHEQSDISIGGVLTFMAVLTVAAIVISVGMWLLFNYFNVQEGKEPKPGPMALSKQERLPPTPRLQAAPGFAVTLEKGDTVNLELREPQAEYRVVRRQWDQALATGLKDQSGNTVGMPIDQAMKSVVTSLPVRTKEAPDKLDDYAVSLPTAASSGRATEKRVQ
jgi:hypothetical protein